MILKLNNVILLVKSRWILAIVTYLTIFYNCSNLDSLANVQVQVEKNDTSSNKTNNNNSVPERIISLESAFNKANQENKEIFIAKYNLAIAKSQITIAKAIANPRFSLQYGFGPAFTIILAGNPQQFGLQFDIPTAGKRSKNINLANSNYELTRFQLAALLFDIHNRTRRAYADLVASEAYEDLIEAQRKSALELQTIAQKRYDAGKSPMSEVLLAKLGVIQFDIQRKQAKTRLKQASATLTQLLGETPDQVEIINVDDNGLFNLTANKSSIVPSPKLDLPNLDELLPIAQAQRPDLKTLIQQAYSDKQAIAVCQARRIPDLFIDSGYQFTTFLKHQPYDAYPYSVPNSPGCYLNVEVELPILYQYQGEIMQSKETWLQDFDQINQLKLQIACDIVVSYEAVQVARANVIKYQLELIPKALKVSNLAFKSYAVGKGDLSAAILARQQYQQILASYFDTVVAYQNAWADLEKAMGVSLKL